MWRAPKACCPRSRTLVRGGIGRHRRTCATLGPVSVDQIAPPLQRVSLTQLLNAAALIALTVSGVAIFVPAVIALLASNPANLAGWTIIGISAAIWLTGFTPALRDQRPWVQSAAAVLLLVLGLIISAGPWLPFATIGFAAIVGAVFTLRVWGVLSMIAVVSILDIIVTLIDPPSLLIATDGIIPVISGALLCVIAGGGLLLAWRAWLARVTEAEADYARVQEAVEQRQRDEVRRRSAEAVTRRIHETVLNTLTALSMGITPSSEADARAACRRDLEQVDLGLEQISDSSVREILRAASQAVPAVDITVDAPDAPDVIVSASVANPLRDALVEALRNVERHSGVHHAVVRGRVTDIIRIDIADDGVGLSAEAEERFGLRNTIRSGMASIGGSARIHVPATGGTVVSLTAPLEQPVNAQSLGLRTVRIVDSSLWARLGVLGTNLFMLLVLGSTVSAFERPGLVAALVLAYVGVLAVLALAWRHVPRVPTTALAAILLVGTFVAAGSTPLSCSATWSVNTLLAGMAGGALLLPLLALNGWPTRLGLAIVAAVASSLLVLAMPAGCIERSLAEWTVTTAYVLAFAFGLSWVEMVFERQRDRAQAKWNEVLARQLGDEERAAAATTWGALSVTARDLLEGIADGTLPIDSDDMAARAATEADALRIDLGLSTSPGDAISHLKRRLVRTAARTGATVEVDLLSEFVRADPYPEGVLAILDDVITEDAGGRLILRGFVDEGFEELVAVVPKDLGDLAAEIDDTTVQFVPGTSETHVIVRRPRMNTHGTT